MKTLSIMLILLLGVFTLSAEKLLIHPADEGLPTKASVWDNNSSDGTDGVSITSWTAKAQGPECIMGHCFFQTGKIYLWGYITSPGDVHSIYDVTANTWATNAATDPGGTRTAFNGYVNGKFWVFGGYSNSNKIRVYDYTTNTWASPGVIPSTVCGSYWYKGGSAYIGNNKIILASGYSGGGWGGSGNTKLTASYDVTSDSWVRLADAPNARSYLASAYLGGKFYLMGGFDTATSATNSCYIYDVATNTWTTGTNLPSVRCYPSGIATPNGVYCIGGSATLTGTGETNVWAMFVGQNSWTVDEPLPSGRQKNVYIAVDGYDIYVGGGSTSDWNYARDFWYGDGKSVGFKDGMSFYKIPGNSRLAKLAPNPWHDAISVKVFFDARAIGKDATITVYDITGHVVYTSSSTRSAAGYATYNIGRSFTSGTYIFSLKVDGKSIDVKKAVKL